jgi:phenylpropionate dioxygenase-like ring-hydroxylating dioxygenase large terminal subunit
MTRLLQLMLVTLATVAVPFSSSAFVVPAPTTRSRSRTATKTTNHRDYTKLFSSSATSSSSSPKEAREQQILPYDWEKQWYALTYASYVPNPSESAENVPAAVFGHPLVLWRSQDNSVIHCADDVCPHRRAALSEGRVRDGKLECYYHGWQFDGESDGACSFIPQLVNATGGATIPKAACLQMRECQIMEGIVWVWMGDPSVPPTKDVPSQGDGLDPLTGKRDGFILNDFQIDLPYDHSYLVENLIDPAHIPISHDRTPGGGKRENAQAYEMVVDKDSISSEGFTGRYRTQSQATTDGPYIEVQYEAPGIIRQQGFPRGKNSSIQFGAALHCMPLSMGRSRLLFRAYFGGLPLLPTFIIGIKPAFLRNLNSCKILEQDGGLITTQEDYFKRTNRRLKDDFLLLQSSDVFVKTYRQWMDQVGHGMPWFQGLVSRSDNVNDHLQAYVAPTPALDPMFHRAGNHLETRYHRHVVHCPETRNALKRIQQLKKGMMGLAIMAITISCGSAPLLLGSSATSSLTATVSTHHPKLVGIAKRLLAVLVPMIPLSCIAAAFLHRLEQRFFVSFKRKEQMRDEKGI